MAPMKPGSNVNPTSPWRITIAITVAVHLASATFHVFFGGMNPDEGFYAIAARSVMHGDVPYRDFGYTQMPLLPYLNGPLLSLAGYGLFEQRWVNGLWGLLSLVVAGAWVARRAGPALGMALVVTFSLTPAWMYFIHLGKTYGFTGLAVMLAAWTFVTQPRGWKKMWAIGILGVLGVGCRLPAAPFFAVLWVATLWEGGKPPRKDWLIACAAVVLPAALLLAPFYAIAPENSLFWTFKFHVLSVPQRARHLAWDEVATLTPGWWLALAVAIAASGIRRSLPRSRETVVALAALAALAANLLPKGVFAEYSVPFLLPLAGAITCELARLADSWTDGQKTALICGLCATHLGFAPLANAITHHPPRDGHVLSRWLPPGVPGYDPELPTNLAKARRVVATIVAVNQPLIGPNIILAAETGREVPRKLRMGPFSTTMDFSAREADQRNLLTYPELAAYWSRDDVPLLAFSSQSLLNYSWSMPSFRNPSTAERQAWIDIFRRDFLVVYEGSTFMLLARRTALPQIDQAGSKLTH